jgi:hypothetical protein
VRVAHRRRPRPDLECALMTLGGAFRLARLGVRGQ